MHDMIDEMTGSGGVDAQMAIEQLRALTRELEAAVAPPEAPSPVAANDASLPPGAESMTDWLRADLAARSFGNAPNPYVELAPLGEPPPPGPDVRSPDVGAGQLELFVPPPSDEVVAIKDEYALPELLQGRRAMFVRNAYRAIMGREPDPEGFTNFDARLALNQITRLEMLADMRYSPEGRAHGARVRGLGRVRVARVVRKVPVIGSVLAILHAMLRLPGMALRIERLELATVETQWAFSDVMQRIQKALRDVDLRRQQLAREMDAAIRTLDESRGRLRAHLLSLHSGVAQIRVSDLALRRWAAVFGENLSAVDIATRRLQAAIEIRATRDDLKRALEQAVAALSPLVALPWELERHKGTVALVEAGAKQALLKVSELEQRHALDIERVSAQLPSRLWNETGAPLDDFYAAFEDAFRGTYEDVKTRISIYVPRVEAAVAAAGPAPVLDLGTGRGEWLELLRDKGIAAQGVDVSEAMVQRVRARGFEVSHGDALDYVRKLPPGSCSAVTAFHLIEHLPFPILTMLVRESFRILRAGGMLLFETPNPENLIVGAHTFWYDPTHLKPLPPQMIQFMIESQGFERAEILRLHPNEAWERIPDGAAKEVRDRLNDLLYGARDYTVIAYKPAAAPASA
jgi:SAM-dependent methyltransferase